jgi:hypothetical protein
VRVVAALFLRTCVNGGCKRREREQPRRVSATSGRGKGGAAGAEAGSSKTGHQSNELSRVAQSISHKTILLCLFFQSAHPNAASAKTEIVVFG